jgi:hypothetical protein
METCQPRKGMSNLRCSTACTADIVARRGHGDWPVCGKRAFED